MIAALAAIVPIAAAAGDELALPSGTVAERYETITDAGDAPRVRYVAQGYEPSGMVEGAALEDTTFLCETDAISEVGAGDGDNIIVSIADRGAPFGVLNMDVRQSFEAFRITDGRCIWEPFW